MDIFEIPSTPNFWHKHRHCCRSPLVPICCTMLLFATFIDTKGMEHSWESNGTFLGNSFQHIFWHEHRHCSWWPLVPIWCNMLQFATFIDRRGLEYCWESHGTFLGKFFHPNFWHERWRCSRLPLGGRLHDPKSVWFFLPEFLFEQNLFTNFFFTKIFLTYYLSLYKKKLVGSPFFQANNTNRTKLNLLNVPNQTYWTKPMKPNLMN